MAILVCLGLMGCRIIRAQTRKVPDKLGLHRSPLRPQTDRLRGKRKSWVFTFLSDDSGA